MQLFYNFDLLLDYLLVRLYDRMHIHTFMADGWGYLKTFHNLELTIIIISIDVKRWLLLQDKIIINIK